MKVVIIKGNLYITSDKPVKEQRNINGRLEGIVMFNNTRLVVRNWPDNCGVNWEGTV